MNAAGPRWLSPTATRFSPSWISWKNVVVELHLRHAVEAKTSAAKKELFVYW
jgi:hypothetical protein